MNFAHIRSGNTSIIINYTTNSLLEQTLLHKTKDTICILVLVTQAEEHKKQYKPHFINGTGTGKANGGIGPLGFELRLPGNSQSFP